MNKREADEFAARLVSDLIEEHVLSSKNPLVYDFAFGEGVEGHKMSEKDAVRAEEAFQRVQDRMRQKGDAFLSNATPGKQRKFRQPKPSGKPGRRWKGYKGTPL
jgi:hypothetical protein